MHGQGAGDKLEQEKDMGEMYFAVQIVCVT